MHEPHPAAARRPAVRAWLYVVAALMVLTLVVGGATRLTESGLSITEWKPVTGVLPPLSQASWQRVAAAVCAGVVAGGVREVPTDSAVPRTESRHERRRIQDHLLVGMEPPPA